MQNKTLRNLRTSIVLRATPLLLVSTPIALPCSTSWSCTINMINSTTICSPLPCLGATAVKLLGSWKAALFPRKTLGSPGEDQICRFHLRQDSHRQSCSRTSSFPGGLECHRWNGLEPACPGKTGIARCSTTTEEGDWNSNPIQVKVFLWHFRFLSTVAANMENTFHQL